MQISNHHVVNLKKRLTEHTLPPFGFLAVVWAALLSLMCCVTLTALSLSITVATHRCPVPCRPLPPPIPSVPPQAEHWRWGTCLLSIFCHSRTEVTGGGASKDLGQDRLFKGQDEVMLKVWVVGTSDFQKSKAKSLSWPRQVGSVHSRSPATEEQGVGPQVPRQVRSWSPEVCPEVQLKQAEHAGGVCGGWCPKLSSLREKGLSEK